MYRMYGNTVQLYRYEINYKNIEKIEIEKAITEGAEEQEVRYELSEQEAIVTEYCISEQHRDDVIKSLGDKEYTVTEIDQTGNEWLDGMQFDSYDKAMEALEKGEELYYIDLQLKDSNTAVELALAEVYEMVLQLKGRGV